MAPFKVSISDVGDPLSTELIPLMRFLKDQPTQDAVE